MDTDTNMIARLTALGIRLVAQIPVPGGQHSLSLRPQELPAFMRDPEKFAAEYMGTSKSKYLDWLQTNGTPRCGKKTKSGTTCKNFISGGTQRSLQDWLALDGRYCVAHGGESSQEAKSGRYES